MVERRTDRRIDQKAPGPARLAPMQHLGERAFDIARRGEDDAAKPLRKGAAIIRHPAVIGAVHRHFERDIVARRPGAEPAGRQGQVGVDPLVIHVGDAGGRVGIDLRRGLALARDAGEAGHVAGRCRVRRGGAELAPVLALALGVGDAAAAAGGAIGRPARQPLLVGGAQIGFEDQGVGPDMGVGIEDPVAVARHQLLRYLSSAASDR